MNRAPEFASYPLAPAPDYTRWWRSLAGFLVVSGIAYNLLLRDVFEPFAIVVGVLGVLLLWLLAFLMRVLFHQLDRHNAHCYGATSGQIQRVWWEHHQQKIGLLDTVLLSATCSKPEQRRIFFSSEHRPPEPSTEDGGLAIRIPQVFGKDVAKRELQLAALLALQWREQQPHDLALIPLQCYWQGSIEAWRHFAEHVSKASPQIQLPKLPEPWQGIDSLDGIFEQLHGARPDARILCAGCQSSAVRSDSRLPAGEAAVLWLWGQQGGVGVSRGEWFAVETEEIVSVAERALQQSGLETPTLTCVSFSQPDLPDLSANGWNTRQHRQDANFGALDKLEAMVALTLAAWHAEANGKPCAWLANDAHHTLALGIVDADDSIN
jgi:hypothetical protein